MNKPILFSAFLLFSVTFLQGQTAMKQWQPLLNQPGMAAYFSGIFENLGVRIDSTGEEFTVSHKGDHFELAGGIHTPDFIIRIKNENVRNMVSYGVDSTVDDQESFRIIRVLLTPMTEATLKNDFLKQKKLLKAGGVENIIHINLLDPSGKENYSQTLVFSEDQWIVVPGLHGNPKRIFNLTPSKAIEYQRNLFAAKKANSSRSWMQFAKWYRDWKKDVSVKA